MVDFKHADDMYARFSKTTICSSIIQSSKDECDVDSKDASPVCADTCVRLPLAPQDQPPG